MNLQTYPELMTVDELAEYLRTSKRTVLNWASRGELPGAKIGSEWRFRRDDVSQWVNNQFKPESIAHRPFRMQDIVLPETVCMLDAQTKEDALNQLLQTVSRSPSIKDPDAVAKAIYQREQLMSTGIGMQIGVPHARLPEVDGLSIVIGLNRSDLSDYESLDSLPVRLLIMILAREDQHKDHLRTLALISDKLKSDDYRAHVLASQNRSELYERLISGSK